MLLTEGELMDVIQNGTARALRLVALGCLAASLGGACSSKSGGNSSVGALPSDVRAIVFLQRMPRTDNGNVFEYTSYVPGGRLVMLSPPSADGKLTVLTSAAACLGVGEAADCFDDADIMSYDLSFDATSVVFSARIKG